MLCLSGFELYSRWVPLIFSENTKNVTAGVGSPYIEMFDH